MSAHVAAPRSRVLAATASVEFAARLAVALGVALLVGLTWMTWGDLGHDTGYDWVAATRLVSHGQVPYVDFPYWYGPLGLWVLSAAYEIFGVNLDASLVLGLALSAGAIVLTYALGRRLTGPIGAGLAALLTATAAFGAGNMSFVLPYAQAAPIAVVLCLAALLAAAIAAQSGRRLPLIVGGVATGLVALTRPEFFLGLLVALCLWLGLRIARAARGERTRPTVDAGLVLGLALVIPAVIYGVLAAQVGLHALVTENLAPTAMIDAGTEHVLRSSAPLTASSFGVLIGRLALYAAGCLGLTAVVALAARPGRTQLLLRAGLGLIALAFVVVLAVNPEAVRSHLYLALAWIPAGAVIGTVVLAWRARPRVRGRGDWAVRDQVALLLVAFLAVLAAKTYAAFVPQPNAAVSQFAIYAMPFAGLFLVWLHGEALPRGNRTGAAIGLGWVGLLCAACIVLAAIDGRHEGTTVRASHGSLALSADEAPAYQAAIAAIERGTRPGERILVAPQLSGLVALTGRQQATVPVSLLPGALATADDERRAIRQMSDVRLAIVDRRPLTEYGQGPFGTTFDRELAAWLQRDFQRVQTLRGRDSDLVIDVWRRRSS